MYHFAAAKLFFRTKTSPSSCIFRGRYVQSCVEVISKPAGHVCSLCSPSGDPWTLFSIWLKGALVEISVSADGFQNLSWFQRSLLAQNSARPAVEKRDLRPRTLATIYPFVCEFSEERKTAEILTTGRHEQVDKNRRAAHSKALKLKLVTKHLALWRWGLRPRNCDRKKEKLKV